MGMAASQARLLTLTARLADNELRSQTINNAKMRLAAQSAQASDEYVRALNDAQFMFRNTDINGLTQNQALNFNVLSAYSPYNTQYGVVNSAGLLLVSEADAKNFEAANGDLDKFLKNYGIGWETSYFGVSSADLESQSICNDLKSVYPDFADLFNKDNAAMNSLYESYNANRFSIENAQYKDVSQSYASELNLLSAKYLNECYNSLFDNTRPEDYAARMLAKVSNAEGAKAAVSSLTTRETYVTNEGRATLAFMRNTISDNTINGQKYVGYANNSNGIKSLINNSINVEYKEKITETTIFETTGTSTTTDESGNTITTPVTVTYTPSKTITETITTATTSVTQTVTTTVQDEDGNTQTVPVTTTVTGEDGKTSTVPVTTTIVSYETSTKTTYKINVPEYSSSVVITLADLVIELDENAFKTVETTTNGVTQTTYTTELKDNMTYEDLNIKNIISIDKDHSPYYYNGSELTIHNKANLKGANLIDVMNSIYKMTDTGYSKYYIGNVDYTTNNNESESEYRFASIILNPETGDKKTYENFLIDYISQFRNKDYFYQEKYANDDGNNSEVLNARHNFENFVFNNPADLNLPDWNGDEILDIQKFLSKKVNGNSLLSYYIGSVMDSENKPIDIFTQEFKNVINAKLIEMMIEELGEPKYTWNDTKDLSNKGNADTKAQWYTNLFNRMLKGYKTLENGLASSKEWLQHAFESGLVSMEQVDSSYNWKGIDYKNCASITEETDNSAAVARAEAKYKRAMNDIKQKDNIFDLQLRNLDTEHTAIQTEYDVVKGVMNKNIERTMKFNQSA